MSKFNSILEKVLGRSTSFLAEDLSNHSSNIIEKVRQSRVLVIGAAGSIGSAFVRELVPFQPAGLHLVDTSENNLVELVRDLRSSGVAIPADFRTYAIDFGQAEMRALLAQERYDYILNFAALKHVRSERDPFTLMRLLDINVLSNKRLIEWIQQTHSDRDQPRRVFAVSSDKSVRPANLMGASKAFMERLFLAAGDDLPYSTARFANVAFSDGSLLHGFRNRIEKKQPLSAPNDIQRYFISPAEAGQLCLLGCFCCNASEIVYPLFEPSDDLMTFSDIAIEVLHQLGYEPVECTSEEEAHAIAGELDQSSTKWPCFFSSSDTSGEKSVEEFVNPGEQIDTRRFKTAGVITHPTQAPVNSVEDTIKQIVALRSGGNWSKEQLSEFVQAVVPEMNLVSSTRNLDQKM